MIFKLFLFFLLVVAFLILALIVGGLLLADLGDRLEHRE